MKRPILSLLLLAILFVPTESFAGYISDPPVPEYVKAPVRDIGVGVSVLGSALGAVLGGFFGLLLGGAISGGLEGGTFVSMGVGDLPANAMVVAETDQGLIISSHLYV
jgi:hypothetical protein